MAPYVAETKCSAVQQANWRLLLGLGAHAPVFLIQQVAYGPLHLLSVGPLALVATLVLTSMLPGG